MAIDHRKKVQQVLLLTLLLNLVVMAIKVALGLATGSLSLLADALHSVTDSANNILGLATSRLSSPYPDRDHPYGHQKYEAVGALGIAAFLGIAFFEIVQSAIERFLNANPPIITITKIELGLMLVVLGINVFVAVYERSVGKRLGSPILVADAKHTMSDVWVTISVLIGLVGVWAFQWQWLDAVLSLPVAMLVFWSGWLVIRENLPWLVDEMAIAPEAIHQLVMQVPGVLNCHRIASRGVVGRQVFIEMHVIVAASDVETAHQITEAVEATLAEQYAPVRTTIHVEPPAYQESAISYDPP
jgi:cation diffusion facilitator family transporter